jgi:ADP-ribose pyrophosphatase YjhB (NUDIX family)
MEIEQAWYRISVKALIYNEKWEFLLCKEDNWLWDIPGGWLDHWEKHDVCIKRELQEEMWLEVIWIDKNPKYFITAHKPESKSRPWLANIFYEVKVKNLNFTPSEECVEIWFFDNYSIESINTIINVKEFINHLKK